MSAHSEKLLPSSQRTFESKLLFLRDIFSNLQSQEEIMTRCIIHKLDRSYLKYVQALNKSASRLSMVDPLKILETMEKEEK